MRHLSVKRRVDPHAVTIADINLFQQPRNLQVVALIFDVALAGAFAVTD